MVSTSSLSTPSAQTWRRYWPDGAQRPPASGRCRAIARAVDLDLPPTPPPSLLLHGTVERFLAAIREKGLVKGEAPAVRLSADRDTADLVGRRRGQPVILTIDYTAMADVD